MGHFMVGAKEAANLRIARSLRRLSDTHMGPREMLSRSVHAFYHNVHPLIFSAPNSHHPSCHFTLILCLNPRRGTKRNQRKAKRDIIRNIKQPSLKTLHRITIR